MGVIHCDWQDVRDAPLEMRMGWGGGGRAKGGSPQTGKKTSCKPKCKEKESCIAKEAEKGFQG